MLELQTIRSQFPILQQKVYDKPLVYLDNGATTHKPLQVINAVSDYYKEYNSNVHRGVHFLSQKATDAQEASRRYIAKFINAKNDYEIIFTRGTTESINLVAYSFGKKYLNEGDEVIVTQMEHHSNFVPWQIACEDRKASLKVLPINDAGELIIDQLETFITSKTKIIALTWVSNTLGTINDIERIISIAHKNNIPVLIDAAQGIQHLPLDVQKLDIDFLAFSGHKIYAPTGIGVLYGKEKWLEEMPPYQSGGSMIKTVTTALTTYACLPFKFEAGTPDVSGIVGLHAALDYVNEIGIDNIHQHEDELMQYATEQLSQIESLRFIGTAKKKAGAVSFLVGDIHPYDMGELLDKQGIAVRTGHHCCQPIMDYCNIPGTVRASFGLYNTKEEIDRLKLGIEKAALMLA